MDGDETVRGLVWENDRGKSSFPGEHQHANQDPQGDFSENTGKNEFIFSL